MSNENLKKIIEEKKTVDDSKKEVLKEGEVLKEDELEEINGGTNETQEDASDSDCSGMVVCSGHKYKQ
ncbi:MAG: hypothetical protein QM610_06795 [Chitinophagaceae bacterium]